MVDVMMVGVVDDVMADVFMMLCLWDGDGDAADDEQNAVPALFLRYCL